MRVKHTGKYKSKVHNFNWDEIQEKHDNGLSISKIQKEFQISRELIDSARQLGLFKKIDRYYKHDEETKSIIKEKALKSKHRRLRKNPILYNGVLLDSTWELELAKRLDSINIKWERPAPLIWKDKNGIPHNYFPDFYLIDYGYYLDPKNSHAMNVQKEKIEILNKLYDIKWIATLEECKQYMPE